MTADLRAALQQLLVARFAAGADGVLTLTPSSERELKAILELFRDHHQPIAPELRISRARLDGLGAIDLKSGTVEVGAGIELSRLEQELRQRDLSLGPLSPGMLALNLAAFLEGPYAGLRILPGGRAEPIPLALTALMADGLRFVSRPTPRSATGPDLDALFLGAEARFGVITSATLRCFARPRAERTAAYGFSNAATATAALRAAIADGCWFRRASLSQVDGGVLLQAEVIGTPEGVERDLSSLAHQVFSRDGRSATPLPTAPSPLAKPGPHPVPERALAWDALTEAVGHGRAATLYRLGLEDVVVSGWTDGGEPLGAFGSPQTWAHRDVLEAIVRQADPLNVLGGLG